MQKRRLLARGLVRLALQREQLLVALLCGQAGSSEGGSEQGSTGLSGGQLGLLRVVHSGGGEEADGGGMEAGCYAALLCRVVAVCVLSMCARMHGMLGYAAGCHRQHLIAGGVQMCGRISSCSLAGPWHCLPASLSAAALMA